MKDKRKYKNLQELAKAFASGEMSRNDWKLILDNDGSYLAYYGPVPEGRDEDEYRDEMYDHGRTLFSGNGYSDLADAVEAAGIPCEWC